MIEGWSEILLRYDACAAAAAVRRYVDECKWPPVGISEITDRIKDATIDCPEPSPAWALCLEKASNPDAVELHPLVRQALRDVGGLWAVRHSDNQLMLRRAFIEHYEARMREARRAIGEGNDWRALAPAVPAASIDA